jgi:hypothetical protein
VTNVNKDVTGFGCACLGVMLYFRLQRSPLATSANKGPIIMPDIPYFLIRGVDPATHIRILRLARARRKSVSDVACELLSRQMSLETWMTPDRSKVAAARRTKIKARRI